MIEIAGFHRNCNPNAFLILQNALPETAGHFFMYLYLCSHKKNAMNGLIIKNEEFIQGDFL